MGRTPPRSCHVWGVIGAGEVVTHLSSRNAGDVLALLLISGGGHRSSCDRNVRQLNGCGLRQQTGRDNVPLPLLVGQSPSEVVRGFRPPPRYKVSTRAVLCSGRPPQPSGSGYRGSVVSPPKVTTALLRAWGSRSLDLFATCRAAKLPLYCSLVPDPQAVFEDAFCLP